MKSVVPPELGGKAACPEDLGLDRESRASSLTGSVPPSRIPSENAPFAAGLGTVSPAQHRMFLLTVVLGDLLVVAVGYILSALLRYPLPTLLNAEGGPPTLALMSGAAIVWFAVLSTMEAYSPRVLLSGADQLVRVLAAVGPAWILTHLLAFVLKAKIPFESRLAAFVSLPAVAIALAGWRLIPARSVARRIYPRLARGSVLVLGDGERAERLARSRRLGDARPGMVIASSLAAISPEEVAKLVLDRGLSEVVIVPTGVPSEEVFDLAFACLDTGAEVQIVSNQLDVLSGRSTFGEFDGIPVMRLRRTDLSGPESLFKRAMDFGGASLGAMLLAPVFLLIAAAIKVSSPGPVLFRQDRVGRKGRRFTMYKFRTMVQDNDPKAHQEYVKSFIRDGAPAGVGADGVKIYKLRSDPRVTRIGAVLRALSLDELPQLWNVLRGEMSLVGPRPCLPLEWEMYRPWQRRRLDVIPGCTGLWQVTARSLVGFEEMVILDLFYAHNSSPGRDLLLIAKTIPAMIRGRGGY